MTTRWATTERQEIPDKDWFWPAEVGRLMTPPVDRRTVLKLVAYYQLPYSRLPRSRYAKIPCETVRALLKMVQGEQIQQSDL